jgi:ribosomal protein L11 methyltransferase
MGKNWIELQIETTTDGAELLAAELSPLTGGVELRDAETVFPTARERAAVVALCEPERLQEVMTAIEDTLAIARAGGANVDPVSVRQRPAHEDEWRDVWKQFFRATRIGRRFVVRPSWDLGQVESADHVIDLDPGRAFGTGAHPSTKLVIAAIERIADESFAVNRFLDLGCGSGILSIAASRLWPEAHGLALDVDAESVDCTRENFELNKVARVSTAVGSLDAADGRFELVMANIQADVLQKLAADFPRRLPAGGRLVLSGLLGGDVEAVTSTFTAVGLQFVSRADDGEWASLVFTA